MLYLTCFMFLNYFSFSFFPFLFVLFLFCFLVYVYFNHVFLFMCLLQSLTIDWFNLAQNIEGVESTDYKYDLIKSSNKLDALKSPISVFLFVFLFNNVARGDHDNWDSILAWSQQTLAVSTLSDTVVVRIIGQLHGRSLVQIVFQRKCKCTEYNINHL